ncbi:MAG: energy transducer TonB [Rhizomicrobium sp.]
MLVFAFLFLLVVSAGASSAQTPSTNSGAIQSNQPASPRASPANQATPPSETVSRSCTKDYPAIAVRLGQQGTTVLTVHVTPTGTVAGVTVKRSSGHEALDIAAVRCAQTWIYRPATQNGTPVGAYAVRTSRLRNRSRLFRPALRPAGNVRAVRHTGPGFLRHTSCLREPPSSTSARQRICSLPISATLLRRTT